MMSAYTAIVYVHSRDGAQQKLEDWMRALEIRDMKVSRKETEYQQTEEVTNKTQV